jgi:glycosyltransferase involved in cell wall biosynthesis
VAALADGLHARGHDVLVIAAGQSATTAPSVATLPSPADHELADETTAALHAMLAEELIADFAPDIVHDHTILGPAFAPARTCPTVTTVHGAVRGRYGELLRRWRGVHPVAISAAHRASAPDVPWVATVRNGIPVSAFPFRRTKNEVLAFVGRMDPEKGVTEAIDVAEAAGLPLLIAARLHGRAEEEYFASAVRPRLSSSVEYVGELGFAAKTELMASSRALLFPLQWEEPYGLVVAEAQACGTPVLSLRRGAVPELVLDRITGLLADTHTHLVPAVADAARLRAVDCRAHAEERLDVSQTVAGYERVYTEVLRRCTSDATVIPLVPAKTTAPLLPQPGGRRTVAIAAAAATTIPSRKDTS